MNWMKAPSEGVETMQTFCPSCGVAVAPSDMRCHNCGSDLIVSEVEAPSTPALHTTLGIAEKTSAKKEQIALLIVCTALLVLFSILGYQGLVSGKKGFALSGAAGAGTQPQTLAPSVDSLSEALSDRPPPPKVITDKAVLERIAALTAQYEREPDARQKRLIALSLSEIFIEQERLDLAGEWSLAAFEATDRKEHPLLLRAANLYDDAKHYATASQLYARYLELEPHDADARVDYAIALLNQGLQREGVSQMRRVVDEHPTHQKANLNLGILYAQIERWEEARKLWKMARDLNPNNDAGKRAAELLERYGSQ